MLKFACVILIAVTAGLALASCQAVNDGPVDCVHRTFGCDMNGRPI